MACTIIVSLHVVFYFPKFRLKSKYDMMLAEKEITTYACFIVFYRNPILYLVSHALFYQKNLKSRQCDRTYLFRPADDLTGFFQGRSGQGMTAALAQPGFSLPALRPFSLPCLLLPAFCFLSMPAASYPP